MAETPLLKAVMSGLCPRCRRGHLFQYNSWLPGKYHVQRANCEHCNLKFELEPAFFIGARYVSYAMMVALIGILFVATAVLLQDPSLTVYLCIIIPAIVLTAPLIQRSSQVIYLYLFGWVKYDATLDHK
jgi:uncharacterized protein (DUF983 family)